MPLLSILPPNTPYLPQVTSQEQSRHMKHSPILKPLDKPSELRIWQISAAFNLSRRRTGTIS